MSSAAGPTSPASTTGSASPPQDAFAREAILAWFRGEFAAANAIIDALCHHLSQITADDDLPDYDPVFVAIHRRRLNWIPVLQMQKYFSISGVASELRRVAAKNRLKRPTNSGSSGGGGGADPPGDAHYRNPKVPISPVAGDSSFDQNVLDVGEQQLPQEKVQICVHHEDCEQRPAMIQLTKGFIAKELVRGHMVNVVKGLKLYEDIFTDLELSKLTDFISELRLSGRKGELLGETFMFFNQQLKGNKREIVQMGVPIFGPIKEDMKASIEPMSSVLQAVLDHLVQWRLIPEARKPNSCLISFFDEGDYSQPYLKPPHLDQPICTLVLSESTMAFGKILTTDNDGNYKGPLILTLKKGSLLVMRGNSAELARHVMCSSPNKRVSITFCKVRPPTNETYQSAIPPLTEVMALWQHGGPQPCKVPVPGGSSSCDPMNVIPKWGVIRAPLVMIAPPRPIVLGPKKIARGGTGVFLPWTMGSRKSTKNLPPRVQRGRFLALPSPNEILPEKSADLDVAS